MNENAEVREEVFYEKKKGRKNTGLMIFLIVLAVFFGFVFVMAAFSENGANSANSPYIAVMHVEGVIQSDNTGYFGESEGYQHQWTLEQIDELMWDDMNKGIFLFLNTPGGGVYESDELYLKLKEYKEETGRPVYAYMGSMAASGGYYISAAADKIAANRNCWTGSIGVTLGTVYDISGFLERYGITAKTITSGANKSMGSFTEPMTEQQQQIYRSLVDEAYLQFVSIVAEGRNMEAERVKQLADGRIYTANQAKNLGLVDEVMTMDEAKDDMRKLYGLQDAEFLDFEYEDTSVLGSLFAKLSLPQPEVKGDVFAVLSFVQNQPDMPISYKCEVLN